MDIATHRIKLNPSRRKNDESIAEGLIQTWKELVPYVVTSLVQNVN